MVRVDKSLRQHFQWGDCLTMQQPQNLCLMTSSTICVIKSRMISKFFTNRQLLPPKPKPQDYDLLHLFQVSAALPHSASPADSPANAAGPSPGSPPCDPVSA